MLALFFRKYPLLSRGAVFLLLCGSVFILCVKVYMLGSLPHTNSLTIESSVGTVLIKRDEYGVPSIESDHRLGGYFGLGYVHAQDRLWQMEMNRRLGSGRLAEVLGSRAVTTDALMRTLGLYEGTKLTFEQIPNEQKQALQEYVNGVNSFISNSFFLPLEFYFMRVKPEQWTINDSLVWLHIMAWSMGGNLEEELERYALTSHFGAVKAGEVKPIFEDETQEAIPVRPATSRSKDSILHGTSLSSIYAEGGLPGSGSYMGSNNWVVSGKHTLSGGGILANDPHLQLRTPAVWYIAHITAGDLNVFGATFPGLPFVVIGRNQRIAWGVTNMRADVQDVRIEKTFSEDPDLYEVDEKIMRMDVKEEKIFVRNDLFKKSVGAISLKVRSTVHGPILSDVLSGRSGPHFSVTWVGYQGLGGTFSSFYRLNYANNWLEFREGLSNFVAPAQNFVYADVDGNIGYIGAGKIPLRAEGNGHIPSAGWLKQFDWIGWIPTESMPIVYNPDSGFLVTANNKIVADDYPYHITDDWAPPYRAKRISDLLTAAIASGKKMSLQDMHAIQRDTVNLMGQVALPLMLRQIERSDDDRHSEALNYLKSWDGDSNSNSIAASLFYAWLYNFNRLTLIDEIPAGEPPSMSMDAIRKLATSPDPNYIINLLSGRNVEWCDFRQTDHEVESCQKLLAISLTHAIDTLEKKSGRAMKSWQWGNVLTLQYPHFPFSKKTESPTILGASNNILHTIFHVCSNGSGGPFSVNVSSIDQVDEGQFNSYWGASYRQIFDLGNDTNYVQVLPGQSGQILSSHYSDRIDVTQEQLYYRLMGSPPKIDDRVFDRQHQAKP